MTVMTDTELKNLEKKINLSLAVFAIEVQRQVLWNLLRNSIVEDMEGIKWLYTRLHEFIEDEFNE
jgi:hypothetical protein